MSYERFLAIGCTHGLHVDQKAIDAVLKFKAAYKPRHTIHLGDFLDTKAMRSGAKGTRDETEPVGDDLNAGLKLLQQFRPTVVLCGNHERRIYVAANHYNAIVADCAQNLLGQINRQVKQLRATLLPYDGNWQDWNLHGWSFMHGTMFSESATRDHAEAFGNVIHAHTHRPAVAKGRRRDNPTGVCVGTLTRIRNMDYADTRRATMSWGQGFAWGEIGPKGACVNLCLGPQEGQDSEWRLP